MKARQTTFLRKKVGRAFQKKKQNPDTFTDNIYFSFTNTIHGHIAFEIPTSNNKPLLKLNI